MHFCLICIVIFLFGIVNPVHAVVNPLSYPNNKYGIHIIQPTDITDAKKLVNSSGGQWGYVTLVIPESDRNTGKWQTIFDELRRSKLIPLVRLATQVKETGWTKPDEKTIFDWINFLGSLNWPVQNRYVMLYNEPNHAREWGGTIDPEGYTSFVYTLGKKLKDSSPDYYLLPAALDVSADGNNETMDAATFLKRSIEANKSLYTELIDGWNSHSYPNPGFSGTPFDTGRGTLRSYLWELSYLESQGISKQFPIFISETGWEHSNGQTFNPNKRNPSQIASYLEIAAETVWNDPRIVAITPFILRYQEYPFDHFSWMKTESTDYHQMYYSYQDLPKVQGVPKQHQSYVLESKFLPKALVKNRLYTFSTTVKNIGQNILDPGNGYQLLIQDNKNEITFQTSTVPTLEPGQSGLLSVQFETPNVPDLHELSLLIGTESDKTLVEKTNLTVVLPPGLTINTSLAWKSQSSLPKVTVLIYEVPSQQLIHKFSGLPLTNGLIRVENLESIIPDEVYRIVVVVPKYVPNQVIAPLNKNVTNVTIPRLLPGDFDEDGNISFGDFIAFLKLGPHTAWKLYFGP